MRNEDLYIEETNNSQPVQTTTQNNSLDFGFFDLDVVLYWVNLFALAWTIIFSILYIYDFFYYRVRFPDGEVEREQKGVKSINEAASLWWTLGISLVFYISHLLTTGVQSTVLGYVTLVAYVFKIFVTDLPDIPVIGAFLGGPGSKLTQLFNDFVKQIGALISDGINYVIKFFSGS